MASSSTGSVRQRINISGVQARWPVNPVTVWRKIRDAGFPAPHYIGNRRYWFADEVEAWLEAQIACGSTQREPASSAQ